MKKFTKILCTVLAAVMLLFTVSVTAFAKASVTDMQKSLVYVSTVVNISATNYNLSFTQTSSGTAFAVGVPGQKVQYVATNYHVVGEPDGIYTLYFTEDDELIDFVQEPDGTAYPNVQQGTIDGVGIYAVTDYWDATTTSMTAHFSATDYVGLTLIDTAPGVDLALCKLSCEPTDKIKAFPIQLKNDVEKGDRIICFGYPGVSMLGNAETRLTPEDCTIQDGMVSKIQRMTGRFGSDNSFDAILVTASIFHGMSGGPVFNEETGAIVGVNCFGYGNSAGEEANYAICIDYLLDMLDREHVDYKIYGGGIPMIAIIIGAAAIFVILLVIIIILATKKKTPAAPVVVPVAPAAPIAPTSAAPAQHKYYLYGLSGPLSGRKFSIETVATIGRDGSRCNVTFPIEQPGVSGLHCEIKVNGGSLYLTDRGSSYGTFLSDGTKLDANTPVILTSGSKFWIGSKENLFEVKY